ncbi:hypothetical protein ASD50_13805 [Mesorhizobium sp. Root552]|uniref:hypothetical protein n=1 Tax=Mesorhizobium sp. Root552 TaxID=1736555 RepID=UPI0006FBF07F|nr:hypothetical protein [Mesorhizobium sp. Root552]KQZ32161.1 hypothetical protein ASD50_13805 [Mesorhizobium sp. Root552]
MASGSHEKDSNDGVAILRKDGCICANGDHADVWLIDEAKSEYEKLLARTDANSRRAAAQLPRYFLRYSQGLRLSDEQFKPQGQKSSGKHTLQIWEFKGYQYRIYGVVVEVGKKRTFIGTAADPSKKNNKANPSIVQKALDNYVRIFK